MRVVVALLFVAACRTPAPAAPPSFLHGVDWKNREYPGSGGKLVGGHNEVRVYPSGGGGHLTIRTDLVGVAYGDLDGDGVEEAVVALRSSAETPSGPQGPHGSVLVYRGKNDVVDEIASKHDLGAPTAIGVVDRRIVVDERCRVELTLKERGQLTAVPEKCP